MFIFGQPMARKGDKGVHAACPGTNTFTVDGASGKSINGEGAARFGDPTKHCGDPGAGIILTGAATVFSD